MKICIMVNDLQNDKPLYLGPNGFSIAYFSTAGICYITNQNTRSLLVLANMVLPVGGNGEWRGYKV